MERSVLRESLCDLLSEEFDISMSPLRDDVQVEHDLGLDSVDMFSLLMEVERCFRIRFTEPEFRSIESVGDILSLVTLKLQQQAASRAA